ncbi:MAG: diadenylate cyclase CdaA [Candidatus Faecousia sp.]|nr:diadenylate cyclase CdaA [Candidatus Faecousia sp.]
MSEVVESIQNFLQIVKGMQWSDYLDILVVAILIYKLLPLLKTPSVMRIARTVIALVVIAWLTNIMKLHTLSWILNQFLAVGLLTFVILFQPELRRMLDHLGNVKLSNFFGVSRPVAEMDAVIAQTVMACEIMSREKVGALIVFAREQRLDEYIKTGTIIDSQVSEQLLRNIFFKNSPLHDGALIIQDGRIVAAGCVLPLSDSPRLGSELGTRHRAGVGMSEVSDAVVVIVSEENGVISVTSGGMLKRHLAPQTLERLLHNELCPADPSEKSIKDPKAVLQSIKNRKKEAGGHEKK